MTTDNLFMTRKRYHFFGKVQSVGFRYTAVRSANALDVSGWVRNERDGSVTIEAQGSEAALSRMIETIRNGNYIVIDRIETEPLVPIENDKGFQVKY